MTINSGFSLLNKIGGFASANGGEIPAFDPGSDRLFVVASSVVEILDLSNPSNPTRVADLPLNTDGDTDGDTAGGLELIPNSVAVGKAGTPSAGIVAVALAITTQATQDSNRGEVQFFRAATGEYLGKVTVGFLPDMLTFTPDGTKILTADEGQPNDAYTNDPVGSVSIINLANGVANATVQTASFESFNSQIDSLRAAGVRIFGPNATVAQDVEPEYIAFNGDGTKAWVTLQENNAVAIVDVASATVESIVPLGFKDHNSVTVTNLETFEFKNLPSIGTTTAGQELRLGGFSGLFYEGTAANGNLKFVTHTDRGPNGEPTGSNRPFLLPNFSPEIIRFELSRSTGVITITERLSIKQADGTPITGLPNLTVAGGTGNTPYNDEVPVNLFGNTISPLDNLGADLEGIVVNPADGTFWMVDEYRPAIYHFDTEGKLIDRFVPAGTAAAVGQTAGDFGDEVLPAVLAQRRQNRGFEAVALNTDNGKLYAFVQSPIRNPASLSNTTLNGLNNIRIVEFDVATKTVTAQYLYRMDNPNLGGGDNTRADKIGDAVYIGNGQFLVVERDDDAIDSDPLATIEKKVYRFSLDGATNITGQDAPIDLGGGVLKSIDQMTAAELASQNIRLVNKALHIDLAKAGYNTVEKVEGLTIIDANTVAVLNDNDFGVAGITINNATGTFTLNEGYIPEPLVLGLITTNSNGFDASDRDVNGTSGGGGKINIQNWPVLGMYQPDAIASFTANGQTYYVTANEGDSRGYDGFSEEVRVGASSYVLDPVAFPNAAQLKLSQNLGRLQLTNATGDVDGDGDIDKMYAFGSRSFSVWDSTGKLVYDSGDDLEQITAELIPTRFNASNDNNNLDDRSDNKGPEPEGVAVGTINNRTYAFIGLERIGGVMVYEVTNPQSPDFVQYINSRDFTADPETNATNSGPEGLTFIPAIDSPNGQALLVVSNEVSQTTEIFTVTPSVRISDIQGASHVSPLVDQAVSNVPGIVTAVDSNGFYLQDPTPDNNLATSEGIFVFTSSAPTVKVGDTVTVNGIVREFTPGGVATGNLSTTQINNPVVTILSSNNPLPVATLLGNGARIPPNQIIDNDPLSSFDATTDGIDFFESLEGMRVTAQALRAVSSTNGFGEIYAVLNNGANTTGLSQRGTINIAPDDFNPERIQIDEDTGVFDFAFPNVNVGALLGDVTGVVGYNFGNFEIIPTQDFVGQIQASTLQPETTSLGKASDKLLVATYNVLNLDPNEGDGDTDIANGRFAGIAQQIINNLNSPDILGLQEVQDNSGSTNDGVTSADVTLQTLVTAITNAGGPTYQFIDNTFITNNASGGQAGANIRTAFLYNPNRVGLVPNSVKTIGSQAQGQAFFDARLPLVADFTFNGETVTVVNNHFSSKGGSSPLFGRNQPAVGDEANGNGQENNAINGSLDQRRGQAQAVNNFVDSVQAAKADAKVIVLGDFNEFEFISPLSILAGGNNPVLTNLTNAISETERYTFNFDGNSQSLDHILVSNNLSTNAQVDIVHVNTEFVDNAQRASDHDPIVAQVTISQPTMANFTLQLLHFSDQEAAIPAIQDAPRLSAVLNALKNQDGSDADTLPDFANTLVLSSGDAYIPGAFLNASAQAYGGQGRADILIQNELGVQAIAFGNHEFDLGTALVANLLKPAAATGNFPAYPGAKFPYLSGNLNFAPDTNLAPLVTADGQEASTIPGKIAASTIITVNGEKIGVVGATTPTLRTISSPGGVGVTPSPFGGTPSAAELDALAAIIQADVNALLAANPDLDKVILMAHMQQIAIEKQLATRLQNVDIIMAGGSNTRLFDSNDIPRAGDSNQGEYPFFTTDAGGKPIAVVNTDGNYKYVGRLVLEFDANGNIIPSSYDVNVSGAYATDAAGVARLNAQNLVDPEIQTIVNNVSTVVASLDGALFGATDVYLNGTRSDIRIQETNLGNLTADANLALGKALDPTVTISLKNGGGVRNDIGFVTFPPGSTNPADALRLPPAANPLAGKEEGDISQLDISNALSFNNGLSLITVTAQQLLTLIEHGFAASSPSDSNTQGRFPQIGGFSVSVDLTRPAGDRVLSLAIENEFGRDVDVVVQNSALVGDPNRTFRMITLDFLANGGDGYPFPTGPATNRIDLTKPATAPRTGAATFAPDGSEQDALAEYLVDSTSRNQPFVQADTPRSLDTRIQNLAFRQDTVIDPAGNLVTGSPNADLLLAGQNFVGINDKLFTGAGNDEVDVIIGGQALGNNRINLGSGADIIDVGNGDRAFGSTGDDVLDASDASGYRLSGGAGNDVLNLGSNGRALGGDGNDRFFVQSGGGNILSGGAGADQFWMLTDSLPSSPNTIADFTPGTDVIGIANQGAGVDFADLSFSGSNIALNGIIFATVTGLQTNTLTAASFVFI